ncbi:MAG: hypothetical protein CW716_01500, partial [Candidatus Bathyarchaeum sp.]
MYFEDFTGAEISYPLTVYESNADKAHIYLDTENDILVAQAMPSGMIEVALAYFPTVACGHAIRTRTKRTVNAPENNVI